MVDTRNFTDFAAAATLTGSAMTNVSPANGGTFTVSSATNWPTANFVVVIDSEEIYVSSRTGTTCTVSSSAPAGRGYNGTTAAAHSLGAQILHEAVSLDYADANAHMRASAGVHGVTGSVVGTSDTQTLTNKTINGGSNTLSAIPNTSLASFVAAPSVTLNQWTAVTLTNSWVTATPIANAPTPAYWVSPTGWVSFQGMIKSGTANAAAFTMPSGVRVSGSRIFICHGNSGTDTQARVIVQTDGTVTPTLSWSNQLDLSMIAYQLG